MFIGLKVVDNNDALCFTFAHLLLNVVTLPYIVIVFFDDELLSQFLARLERGCSLKVSGDIPTSPLVLFWPWEAVSCEVQCSRVSLDVFLKDYVCKCPLTLVLHLPQM